LEGANNPKNGIDIHVGIFLFIFEPEKKHHEKEGYMAIFILPLRMEWLL